METLDRFVPLGHNENILKIGISETRNSLLLGNIALGCEQFFYRLSQLFSSVSIGDSNDTYTMSISIFFEIPKDFQMDLRRIFLYIS